MDVDPIGALLRAFCASLWVCSSCGNTRPGESVRVEAGAAVHFGVDSLGRLAVAVPCACRAGWLECLRFT